MSPENQLELFESEQLSRKPPTTRYQGSKLKLLEWIWGNISDLEFHTVLDVFGGTGVVSYFLKCQGKQVTYNDYLKFNQLIGMAIVENLRVQLSDTDIALIVDCDPAVQYDDFIERTFHDIYFTDEENRWLDVVCQNIPRMEGKYKRAIAYYALFQACIIKRPYNLFHRKNLYMRTSEVKRGFGNKATWDKPFPDHFRTFVAEANQVVFDLGVPCEALCFDALEIPGTYDLVYIDPPYVSNKGIGVDYFAFYHVPEAMVDYGTWSDRIDRRKKHLPLMGIKSPWSDKHHIKEAFKKLFERYADSVIVVSYRSDGIPSEEELVSLLKSVKTDVDRIHFGDYKYVLSTNGNSREVLLIGS